MAKQALDGHRLNAFGMDPAALTIIGLDTTDGPEHPLYDSRVKLPVEDNMVLNVMAFGVLEAVLVRKNGDKIEVVAGRQRVRWARAANAKLKAQGSETIDVPCMVRKGSETEMFGVTISENEIRRDDSPLIKAEKCRKYMAMGRNEEQAATAFGVSRTAIQNWMALVDLDKKVLDAVDAEKISASAAVKLAGLSHAEQKDALDTLLGAGAATTANAKLLADAAKAAAADKKDDAEKKDAPAGKPKKPKLKKKNSKGMNRKRIKAVLKACHGTKGASEDAVLVLEWVLGFADDESLKEQVKGFKKVFEAVEGGAL